MSAPNLSCALDAVDALDVDALVLFISRDVRPLHGVAGLVDWRSCGELSSLMLKERFVGNDGEVVLTNSRLPGAKRIFLFGVGASTGLRDRATKIFTEAAEVLKSAGAGRLAVVLPHPGDALIGRAEDVFSKAFGKNYAGVFASESTTA